MTRLACSCSAAAEILAGLCIGFLVGAISGSASVFANNDGAVMTSSSSTSKPLDVSMMISLTVLFCSFFKSAGSTSLKASFQKGWSIQGHFSSWINIPKRTCFVEITFNICHHYIVVTILAMGSINQLPYIEAFSAATLSIASQVNSGSSRPKWP